VSQGLYESVAAMHSAGRRMEAITSNLANLGVHGFKRRSMATNAFDAVLRGQVQRQLGVRTVVDHSQGSLVQSEGPYDLALSGPGFFAVETRQGEAYTRNGQFRVDDSGVLQTLEGYPVAWRGPRGTLDPTGAEVLIDPEGNVLQGDEAIGQLRITSFERAETLEQDRRGFYHATGAAREVPHGAVVRQGMLEAANANAVDEMVSMINAQRAYESATRLMQMIDQTYRRLNSIR
jgi:flagellar basal-body rod protein FlgG